MIRSCNVRNLRSRVTFLYMLRNCGRSSGKVTFCITGTALEFWQIPTPSNAEYIIVCHFAEKQEGVKGEHEIQIEDGNKFCKSGIYIPPSQTEIIKFTLGSPSAKSEQITKTFCHTSTGEQANPVRPKCLNNNPSRLYLI